jgi:hypothetical protein
MVHEQSVPPGELEWPFTDPRPALVVGFVSAGAAWLLAAALGGTAVWLRVVFIGLSLLAAAVAAAIGVRNTWRDPASRYPSAAVLALAGVVGIVANVALDEAWDMAVLTLWLAVAAAFAGAVLLLLPRWARRVAASLFVLFHFGGILTAVGMVPAADGSTPWLASQLWTRVYSPYLQFTYLNNGYHFYSPEPGPTALFWFRVAYADGTARWVKITNAAEDPGPLTRRRLESLPAGASQTLPAPPNLAELAARHSEAVRAQFGGYPFIPGEPSLQYREPPLYVQRLLRGYIGYIARAYPHPTDPSQRVTGVKAYHVEYWFPSPEEMAEGIDPYDPTLYLAFYLGDFEPNGEIKESCLKVEFNADGGIVKKTQDPFLNWLIPIVRDVGDEPWHPGSSPGLRRAYHHGDRDRPVRDYVKIHAGDERAKP